MSFGKRTLVLAFLLAMALGIFATARHYAPLLVLHVVEQTLLQKAPDEMSSEELRRRFHAMVASLPGDRERLDRLLEISQYLEKTQRLRGPEVEWILREGAR